MCSLEQSIILLLLLGVVAKAVCVNNKIRGEIEPAKKAKANAKGEKEEEVEAEAGRATACRCVAFAAVSRRGSCRLLVSLCHESTG